MPVEVHVPELVTVTVPLSEELSDDLHFTWSGPALTVGAVVIVAVITELVALHCPTPVVVKVKLTVPALISAALGV